MGSECGHVSGSNRLRSRSLTPLLPSPSLFFSSPWPFSLSPYPAFSPSPPAAGRGGTPPEPLLRLLQQQLLPPPLLPRGFPDLPPPLPSPQPEAERAGSQPEAESMTVTQPVPVLFGGTDAWLSPTPTPTTRCRTSHISAGRGENAAGVSSLAAAATAAAVGTARLPRMPPPAACLLLRRGLVWSVRTSPPLVFSSGSSVIPLGVLYFPFGGVAIRSDIAPASSGRGMFSPNDPFPSSSAEETIVSANL